MLKDKERDKNKRKKERELKLQKTIFVQKKETRIGREELSLKDSQLFSLILNKERKQDRKRAKGFYTLNNKLKHLLCF
jgi:hypothetical protein